MLTPIGQFHSGLAERLGLAGDVSPDTGSSALAQASGQALGQSQAKRQALKAEATASGGERNLVQQFGSSLESFDQAAKQIVGQAVDVLRDDFGGVLEDMGFDGEAAKALLSSLLQPLQQAAMRALALSAYSPRQIDAGLAAIGTLDTGLIRDGTYYVAVVDGVIVACGGWSRRAQPQGSYAGPRGEPSPPLRPGVDAARIRAFFTHPDWAGRGIARALAVTAESAARLAGFRHFELIATINAERLYSTLGYRSLGRLEVDLPGGVQFPAVRMAKSADRGGISQATAAVA